MKLKILLFLMFLMFLMFLKINSGYALLTAMRGPEIKNIKVNRENENNLIVNVEAYPEDKIFESFDGGKSFYLILKYTENKNFIDARELEGKVRYKADNLLSFKDWNLLRSDDSGKTWKPTNFKQFFNIATKGKGRILNEEYNYYEGNLLRKTNITWYIFALIISILYFFIMVYLFKNIGKPFPINASVFSGMGIAFVFFMLGLVYPTFLSMFEGMLLILPPITILMSLISKSYMGLIFFLSFLLAISPLTLEFILAIINIEEYKKKLFRAFLCLVWFGLCFFIITIMSLPMM